MAASPACFGVIGAGSWGGVYARTLQEMGAEAFLGAISPRRPEGVELGPDVQVVEQWEQVVEAGCDAVIIASPPHAHPAALDACLDRSIPCIVEKPFCLDVPTAERLHDRVKATSLPVLVDHIHLFNDGYRHLSRALMSTGDPLSSIISEGGGVGPFNRHTPALWDWCSHDLSLLLDLVGHPPSAMNVLGGLPGPDGAPEVLAVAMEFPEGVSAWIHAGRQLPRKRRSLSVFTEKWLYVWDDLYDDGGVVRAPVDYAARYQAKRVELRWEPVSGPVRAAPLLNLLRYFLQGLQGGDQSLFGTDLAVEVVRLLARCEESISR